MTFTLKLKGTVRALTDLSMTLPNAPHTSGRPKPVPRMFVMEGGAPVERLYMNAGTFRGSLRDAAFRLVRDDLQARNGGEPVLTLSDTLLMAKGGVKSEGKESYSPTLQNTIRANNPHLSLFGASEPWIKGRLSVSHLVSNVSPEHVNRHSGVRKKLNASHLEALPAQELAEYLTEDRLNNQRSVLKREKEQLEEEIKKKSAKVDGVTVSLEPAEVKARENRLTEVVNEIKEISAQTKSTVSMLMPLEGYEAIPQGAEMSSEITIQYTNEIEVGLFLLALEKFAIEEGTLGGHIAHGLGRVSGQWAVTRIDGTAVTKLSDTVTFVAHESFSVPSELAPYMESAREWLQAADVEKMRVA